MGNFTRGSNEGLLFFRAASIVCATRASTHSRIGNKILTSSIIVRIHYKTLRRSIATSIYTRGLNCAFLCVYVGREFRLIVTLFFPSISNCLSIFSVNSRGGLLKTMLNGPFIRAFQIFSHGTSRYCRLYTIIGNCSRIFIDLSTSTRVSFRKDSSNGTFRGTMVSCIL